MASVELLVLRLEAKRKASSAPLRHLILVRNARDRMLTRREAQKRGRHGRRRPARAAMRKRAKTTGSASSEKKAAKKAAALKAKLSKARLRLKKSEQAREAAKARVGGHAVDGSEQASPAGLDDGGMQRVEMCNWVARVASWALDSSPEVTPTGLITSTAPLLVFKMLNDEISRTVGVSLTRVFRAASGVGALASPSWASLASPAATSLLLSPPAPGFSPLAASRAANASAPLGHDRRYLDSDDDEPSSALASSSSFGSLPTPPPSSASPPSPMGASSLARSRAASSADIRTSSQSPPSRRGDQGTGRSPTGSSSLVGGPKFPDETSTKRNYAVVRAAVEALLHLQTLPSPLRPSVLYPNGESVGSDDGDEGDHIDALILAVNDASEALALSSRLAVVIGALFTSPYVSALEAQVEVVRRGFYELGREALDALAAMVAGDVASSLRSLITTRWYAEHPAAADTITMTLADYYADLKQLMAPEFFAKLARHHLRLVLDAYLDALLRAARSPQPLAWHVSGSILLAVDLAQLEEMFVGVLERPTVERLMLPLWELWALLILQDEEFVVSLAAAVVEASELRLEAGDVEHLFELRTDTAVTAKMVSAVARAAHDPLSVSSPFSMSQRRSLVRVCRVKVLERADVGAIRASVAEALTARQTAPSPTSDSSPPSFFLARYDSMLILDAPTAAQAQGRLGASLDRGHEASSAESDLLSEPTDEQLTHPRNSQLSSSPDSPGPKLMGAVGAVWLGSTESETASGSESESSVQMGVCGPMDEFVASGGGGGGGGASASSSGWSFSDSGSESGSGAVGGVVVLRME
ncbi:uncharacterized protein AMSG_10650 [Thecamonas trahens ATCC 50062]|uniref:Uncharacterized protein n=1 Tax=Thecamonas trahens ATCC 50062 TaxID=461836 RepID=A0A0L0DRU8_THETB|nr:hypothetical protein AMSG_10650 [Thecamonas trahens ATCC 50062]KNC55054.1 hypothetical protein AMSG_10650 [Thecamonas trahens ATCC 50062]|eukprot:XP_013753358.1 hypothetical protein AMSG_10650 [Thecamonas trahens ATCC 50062]